MKQNISIIWLILTLCIMSSCFTETKREFKFYISEVNMYVTTFKRPGKFYVLISPTRYETSLSDSIDYIELRIGAYANIILDSLDNRNVFIEDYYGDKKPKIHKVNYNINLVESNIFSKQYFDNHLAKKGYILMNLSTDVYGINVAGKGIKEENIWGD